MGLQDNYGLVGVWVASDGEDGGFWNNLNIGYLTGVSGLWRVGGIVGEGWGREAQSWNVAS